MVMFAVAPVRLDPERLKVCDVEFWPTVMFPKFVNVVGATIKEGATVPHGFAAEELFRGAGEEAVKSFALL